MGYPTTLIFVNLVYMVKWFMSSKFHPGGTILICYINYEAKNIEGLVFNNYFHL